MVVELRQGSGGSAAQVEAAYLSLQQQSRDSNSALLTSDTGRMVVPNSFSNVDPDSGAAISAAASVFSSSSSLASALLATLLATLAFALAA